MERESTYPTKLTGSKFGTSSTQKGLQMGGICDRSQEGTHCSASYFLFAPSASEIRLETGTMLKKSVNLNNFAEEKPPNAGVVGKAIQD